MNYDKTMGESKWTKVPRHQSSGSTESRALEIRRKCLGNGLSRYTKRKDSAGISQITLILIAVIESISKYRRYI